MALEDALQAERNKALNQIRGIIRGPLDYCWQEETAEEVFREEIERVIENLDRTCKAIKEKDRQKKEQSEHDRREK